MPVRKVVLEVNQSKASHEGMREFLLHRLGLVDLARRYPFVEFVVQDRPTPHPVIRGFYSTSIHPSSCHLSLVARAASRTPHPRFENA